MNRRCCCQPEEIQLDERFEITFYDVYDLETDGSVDGGAVVVIPVSVSTLPRVAFTVPFEGVISPAAATIDLT